MKRGFLISFEGLDKVGKSTQVELLMKHLNSKGHDPVLVREPGSSAAGERIRTILADPELKGKIAPLCEFLLYSASRAQLVAETISPMLEKGEIVIADRFYDSSTAYQGYGRGIDLGIISHVNAWVTGGLIPDLTILLYVEKFAAANRKANNRFAPSLFDDRLEQEFLGFRKKVQQGFLEIATREKERFLVIEASEKKDQIARKIATRVDRMLRARTK
ncbi:MAG: dTMP kinase [candidate division Zixibacteria bacterium RBG_16_53_22]|nr:MAG: dTMP kinase [candidate division Zixibacteria bacterium RBG_16_53_22]